MRYRHAQHGATVVRCGADNWQKTAMLTLNRESSGLLAVVQSRPIEIVIAIRFAIINFPEYVLLGLSANIKSNSATNTTLMSHRECQNSYTTQQKRRNAIIMKVPEQIKK